MARKVKAEFEAKLDRPLCEVLVEAFNQYGSLYKASAALGITHTTMSLWLKECGYEVKLVLVPYQPKEN